MFLCLCNSLSFFSGNTAANVAIFPELYKLPGEALVVPLTPSNQMPTCCTSFWASFWAETVSANISVAEHGYLNWASPANVDTEITVTVTDGCGLSTQNVSLKIYDCQCQNGGTCQRVPEAPEGSGQYTCRCPKYFPGAFCNGSSSLETMWTTWSKCDTNCDYGMRYRTRNCSGYQCEQEQEDICIIKRCEGKDLDLFVKAMYRMLEPFWQHMFVNSLT